MAVNWENRLGQKKKQEPGNQVSNSVEKTQDGHRVATNSDCVRRMDMLGVRSPGKKIKPIKKSPFDDLSIEKSVDV